MKIDSLLRQDGMFAPELILIAGCGGAGTETGLAAPIVSVMTVRVTRLALTQDLPGRVAAVRIAEIRTQVSGIVQRRLSEQGTEVRASQGLVPNQSGCVHGGSRYDGRTSSRLSRCSSRRTRTSALQGRPSSRGSR